MKKLISLVLVLSMVMVLGSPVFAVANSSTYSTDTVSIDFKSYVNTKKQYKPYDSYGSNTLWFTVYAQVYESKTSTTPAIGDQYAQLFKVTIPGFPSLPMQRKLGWDGDSTNYHTGLSANTYYTVQFGNEDGDYYIRGTVEIRHNGSK